MAVPEKVKLSDMTELAMVCQFLGFMLDAFDMALVIAMAPIFRLYPSRTLNCPFESSGNAQQVHPVETKMRSCKLLTQW
jgi:hypothetical protein